ncbi:hypothetical protein QBA54_42895 [Streptomyces sp. B21-108]|uniref:hypothetical protein n=1 Tax=Streptomyces sp. B21-108 TaxID=3039419 RepID=UPI002FF02DA4
MRHTERGPRSPSRAGLQCQSVGGALLVHREGRSDPRVRAFADGLAHDPEHTLVVVDLPQNPPAEDWESVARLLKRRGRSFRVITGRPSRESAMTVGRLLADRLDRTVLTPDGWVLPAPGGGLFVPEESGSGWLSFHPRRSSAWTRLAPHRPIPQVSRRFPVPDWDHAVPRASFATSAGATAEPVPAGVWIFRSDTSENEREAHRGRLAAFVLCQSDRLTVALGCPGGQELSLTDIERFWGLVAPEARPLVRFSPYGPVGAPESSAFGQTLADRLGEEITVYAGLPTVGEPGEDGPLVRALGEDGTPGPPAFVRELVYRPARAAGSTAPAPVLRGRRPPMEGLPEVATGVHQYTHDAVLEVTQSGLWIRPPEAPADARAVHRVPADPGAMVIHFDARTSASAQRMRSLAEEVRQKLDPMLAEGCRVLPAPKHAAGKNSGTASSPARREGAAGSAAGAPKPAPEHTRGPAVQKPGPATGAPESAPGAVHGLAGGRPGGTASGGAESGMPGAGAGMSGSAPGAPGAPGVVGEMYGSAGGVTRAEGGMPDPVPGPVTGESRSAGSVPEPAVGRPGSAAESSAPASGPVEAQPGSAPAGSEPAPAGPAAPGTPQGQSSPLVPMRPRSLRLESAPPPGAEAAAPAEASAAGHDPVEPEPVAEPAPPRRTPQPAPPSANAPTPAPARAPAGTPASPGLPAQPAVRVQRVPKPEACAAPPARGLEQERTWLRRTLKEQYDSAANHVARVLSESPGLRGGSRQSADDVVTDLVAVRLYLSGGTDRIDSAVRSAAVGPHVPLARCVASGLRRLPSYRGATVLRTTLSEAEWQWYGKRRLVTEWAFCSALTTAHPDMAGDVDVLIWSMTARRTALLDTTVPDRVLYLPGTSFKVLGVREEERRVLLLRELTGPEIGTDGSVDIRRLPLDDLAMAGLEQAGTEWRAAKPAARLPVTALSTLGNPPGLITTGRSTRTAPHRKGTTP